MPFLRSIREKSPENPVPDEALLKAYQENADLQALADLYQRYMDLVYGLCIKYLKDAESSRDAVMGIFEVLVRDLRKTYTVERFKPWLYSVARNYCLMQLRAAGKEKIIHISEEFMQSEEDLHLSDKEEQVQKLERCLEGLPPAQRQIVLLFYKENKCYNEIQALTGHEWKKVRSFIQNGRRNLKICMEKKEHVQKGVR